MQFQWEGVVEDWTNKFVAKNLWRITRWGAFEDAVQQCAVIFVNCNNLYGSTVDNLRWFMALYKISVRRHFHSLALRNAKRRNAEAVYAAENPEQTASLSNVLTAQLSMSPELEAVIRIIADAPREILEALLEDGRTLRASRGRTKMLNHHWQDVLGFSCSNDLVAEIVQLLKP